MTVDRVVLALPFSVMRERVDWSTAGFPVAKSRAITELGMRMNAKLALQFSTRHWNALGCGGDTFSDTGYQATWKVTRAQPGTRGILVDYTGAGETLKQSGRLAAALAPEFLTRVEPVLPGLTSKWNGKATFDDWPRNPCVAVTRDLAGLRKPGATTVVPGFFAFDQPRRFGSADFRGQPLRSSAREPRA